MLALHCLVTAAGELALWAEDSDLPTRRAGRASRTVEEHPFAVPASVLAERVAVAGAADESRVLLPSRPSAPVASPELVRDPLTAPATPRGAVTLRPWRVPTVRLAPAVFAASPVAERDDVRAGASVRFLSQVAAFAEDLVTRGRVLPSIVSESGRPAARWRPTLSGVDSARYARLRDALPPVLRAVQVDPELLDGRPVDDVLHPVLDAFVDAAARARLTGVRLAPPGRFTAAEAAAGALLRGLVGDNPRLAVPPERATRLASAVDTWRSGAVHDGPVRACFRLRSPDQAEDHRSDDWTLEFLLQAADDPSVLVSAAQVWSGDRDQVLRRWVARPAELLLADLGRAGRVYPDLDAALREAHPVGLRLDTAGAHRFLSRAAALDQAGFGVLLPSWWRASSRVGLKLTTTSRGTAGTVTRDSVLGKDELVDYRWDLALGDLTLTEDELRELAAAKVPLVRVRGQWVHVDQRQLAAGLAFLERSGDGRMSVGEVLELAGMPADDDAFPLPVVDIGGTGWLADLLGGAVETTLEPVDTPEGFTADLRPYQRRGLAWLVFLDRLGLGACLADDMGLGKTVQLLALEALARSDTERPPTLLVCPMSVVGNWQREAERFTPGLRVHVHHGADRLTGPQLAKAVSDADLVITTYALAARDAAALGKLTWDRIVLDEAQNIKNSAARQSQAVRSLRARHRVALTGTPVENRLAELWSIMDFANPGLLGPLARFRARFAVPVERHNDEDAAARLRRITGPFVLRRVKTDPAIIDDLPDKLEMKQLCNLTAEQASLYRAVVDDMLAKIDESEGVQRKGLVLATMTKLKQVCNHPAQFLGDGSRIAGRSGKLARLEDTLEEVLADGDRALCFTQFAAFGGMLVPYLAARFDTEVAFLHGGTPKRQRDTLVERFQSGEGPSIFLLSLKAGGTGLTLTAANHVIHLDRWWNPAVEDQATDRAFRIGQRRDVQVRKFVCIGTLEERIDKMIEQKKALAQLVVGAGENWLTELSTAELRELVTLSSEAVGE
ncbi:DEAD/DEAH box helicase [Actinokineospora iranica]|uniref:Superfamily II DNA or RNA helicase, SNF2 family n=1 Tax=Actinokineospora iranica TaxID=1271860 RepID=A0A1G6LTZ7_9PSEU|nr:DEAD/DEAH box helicase [Actinokineospora iranica]SDC46567.1 Superfamily II DNA or RNA helicase, SNF2 family [Actinokineospora iranica]